MIAACAARPSASPPSSRRSCCRPRPVGRRRSRSALAPDLRRPARRDRLRRARRLLQRRPTGHHDPLGPVGVCALDRTTRPSWRAGSPSRPTPTSLLVPTPATSPAASGCSTATGWHRSSMPVEGHRPGDAGHPGQRLQHLLHADRLCRRLLGPARGPAPARCRPGGAARRRRRTHHREAVAGRQVYVVGYPQVLPTEKTCSAVSCRPLAGRRREDAAGLNGRCVRVRRPPERRTSMSTRPRKA